MSTTGDHLDRLTAVDASFLTNESSSSHMHVGAILIFEGPPPLYVDLVEHIRGRLNQVPRFRQRIVVPPLEAGRPLWADDVNFNLTYHIRHTGLPEPGGEDELRQLAARVFSQQLDRSKPLWELWLVQGLERDRFAILTKTHHAMVDGVSGVDIGTVLFDLEPVPKPSERGGSPTASRGWGSSSAPSPTPPPTCRSTRRSGRTGASSGHARSWRPSNGSRTASAAPSTTSCSPW
jgi:diacylglycerol O-acyltransferase